MNFNPDKNFGQGNKTENIKNKELVERIKQEYPTFKHFWNSVLEQLREGQGSIYQGDTPSPLYVARFFASQLNNIKVMTAHQTSEVPVEDFTASMATLQKAMGDAVEIYYGEKDILDENGIIKV